MLERENVTRLRGELAADLALYGSITRRAGHFDQEEIFFILEGTYQLTVGDQTTTASPGSIIFIPRNVIHRFKNVGDTTACMLDWSLPGGQDRYFKAMAELTPRGRLRR